MQDYVERVTEIYRELKAADDIDVRDVASLTAAILQEEAKDRRMAFIDEQKNQRVQQMRSGTAEDAEHGSAEWRDDPATAAQKKALRNLDVSFDDDVTKGEASDLIDESRAQKDGES